jgi:hypothetical protein
MTLAMCVLQPRCSTKLLKAKRRGMAPALQENAMVKIARLRLVILITLRLRVKVIW